jgi:hypothetical protein
MDYDQYEKERMLSKAVPLDDLILELYKNKGLYQEQSAALLKNRQGHMADQYYYRDPELKKELGALNLMVAAEQAPNTDGWLGALGPYRNQGKQLALDYNRHQTDVNGVVRFSDRNIANVYNDMSSPKTIPHELEHTLQLGRPPGADTVQSDFGQRVPLGAIGDSFFWKLMENAKKLNPEQQQRVFPAGNAFNSQMELFANIAAHSVVLASMGVDFLDTEEGKLLFPDKEAQAYFIKAIHPGIKSMWAYREDKNGKGGTRKPQKGPRSYAQKGYDAIKSWWNESPKQMSMLELDKSRAKKKAPTHSRKVKK